MVGNMPKSSGPKGTKLGKKDRQMCQNRKKWWIFDIIYTNLAGVSAQSGLMELVARTTIPPKTEKS